MVKGESEGFSLGATSKYIERNGCFTQGGRSLKTVQHQRTKNHPRWIGFPMGGEKWTLGVTTQNAVGVDGLGKNKKKGSAAEEGEIQEQTWPTEPLETGTLPITPRRGRGFHSQRGNVRKE